MKLYTETEITESLESMGFELMVNDFFQMSEPIELPSDKDIESGMNQRLFLSDKNAHFNSGAKAGFKLGAKWMKEQILKNNK
jgi:hypothetical protein